MIAFDAVTKTFGGLAAVDNVSFQVGKGDYFALLGPNGAGKTTIVRLLLDFSKPSSGRIAIDGIPVSRPESRIDVGYLAENYAIPPFLSGREYLKRHASLAGLSGREAVMEVDRVLETVSMRHVQKKKSNGYSRGMRQRIGLAAAILGRPKLLLLDEPATGLDPIGIRDFRTIIGNLRNDGVTVMLSSHQLSEVETSCKTAAIMHGGRMLVKDSIHAIVHAGETLEEAFVRWVGKQDG